jgi:hypothetical protein
MKLPPFSKACRQQPSYVKQGVACVLSESFSRTGPAHMKVILRHQPLIALSFHILLSLQLI